MAHLHARTLITGLSALILASACVKATESIDRSLLATGTIERPVEAGDAIVVVPDKAVGCLSKSLGEIQPDLRLVPGEQFRNLAFPEQTADQVNFAYPITGAQQQMLATETVRKRIAPLRLRYLVAVGEEVDRSGGELVGLFELWSRGVGWNFTTSLNASVFDLMEGRETWWVSVRATGQRAILLAWGIIPVPVWFETTRRAACNDLGTLLGKYLAGQNL